MKLVHRYCLHLLACLFAILTFVNTSRGRRSNSRSIFSDLKSNIQSTNQKPSLFKSLIKQPEPADNPIKEIKTYSENKPQPKETVTLPKKKDDISKIIEEKQQLIDRLDHQQKENLKLKSKEIENLKSQFNQIHKITADVEKKLAHTGDIQGMHIDLMKDNSIIDEYVEKYTQLEHRLNNIAKKISQIEEDVNDYPQSQNIFALLENLDNAISDKITIGDVMNITNAITNEVQLENVRIVGDMIEVDNSFHITVGSETYSIVDLLYYHSLVKKMTANCGENMECLVSIEEEKNKKMKEKIVMNTIETIKHHLYILSQ